MAFQELLNQVGSLGRFQILQMTFLLICSSLIYSHFLVENFTAAIPSHRCWVPILDNDTVSDNDSGILSHDAHLRISIPLDSNLRPEKCRRFIRLQWHLLHLNGSFSNVTVPDTEPCMEGWVYDRSTFISTTVTEWDLVCASQSMNSVAKFAFVIGGLIGHILGGYLSDRFGRKLIFTCALLQAAVSETCAALAPTFLIYCLLRFVAGISQSAIVTNTGLLMIEWTSPKFQSVVMAALLCSGSVGQLLLAGLAFAIGNWRNVQLALSTPIFFLLIPTRWLSESARWLIMTNKPQKGLEELRKAAHMNGMRSSGDRLTMEVVRTTMKNELEAARTKLSPRDLYRMPNLRKRICLMSLVRFVMWLSITGLMVHLQHLSNNIFLLQCLFGIVSIPANVAGNCLLNYMDRRIGQLLLMFLYGFSILATLFIPQEMQTLRIISATLGGAFCSAASTVNFVHANELYPTMIRATALGIISVAGSIGAALAPLFMILTTYSASLPWIIYGVLPILGGLLVLLLPETRNQSLPDSIEDVENEEKAKDKQSRKMLSPNPCSFKELQELASD